MTREFNVQQEKQDITSSDKSGKSIRNGVGYTKIHIRHNILISGKCDIWQPFSPQMLDKTVFTVYG